MKYLGIVLIVLSICIFIIYELYSNRTIPIVVIGYNNLFFMRNFINQLKRFDNKIIILDNKSTYEPLLKYYKEIKSELGTKLDVRLLETNYGSAVYIKLKHTLPSVYVLSDCDLELNPKMPVNFSDILYKLSVTHGAYKVGLALDISEKDKLLDCKDYTNGKSLLEWESPFWKTPIYNDTYELYKAPIDTTFSLINYSFPDKLHIRVAGDFTAKHLPWYKNFLKKNIPKEELVYWKDGNNSSSILLTCLDL